MFSHNSIIMLLHETILLYEESQKDETCLQFKMNKYFIRTRKNKFSEKKEKNRKHEAMQLMEIATYQIFKAINRA